MLLAIVNKMYFVDDSVEVDNVMDAVSNFGTQEQVRNCLSTTSVTLSVLWVLNDPSQLLEALHASHANMPLELSLKG